MPFYQAKIFKLASVTMKFYNTLFIIKLIKVTSLSLRDTQDFPYFQDPDKFSQSDSQNFKALTSDILSENYYEHVDLSLVQNLSNINNHPSGNK